MKEKAMTEKATETPGQGDNSKALDEAILKLRLDLVPIEAEMIQLRVKRKEIRKTFSAATGIALADFDAARRLSGIEDDDERRTKINGYRRCYNTLMPGEQLSWLDPDLNEQADAGGNVIDAKDAFYNNKKRMENNGYTIGLAGGGAEKCPVATDHKSWKAWQDGWERAQKENAPEAESAE